MAKVEVSADILKWAADRSGKSDIINMSFPNWLKWINNETQPTLKQLEKFAKATSIPLGYFFLDHPPVECLPIPHYRTIDDHQTSNPSPNLLETVQIMERRQGWMREYLIDLGNDTLDFVGVKNVNSDPIEIAKEIRAKLGLKDGWASKYNTWQEALRMLYQKIENVGIILVINGIVGNNTHRKLDVNEFRGFVLTDEYAPLIFINGADGKAAQMFTLAHELAHVWFGVSAAFDLRNLQAANNDIEKVCNIVAAEFLVPEIELREIWKSVKNKDLKFQVLARHFKVSEIVAARRALDLTLITRDEFFQFYQNSTRAENHASSSSSSGGDFYASQNFRIGRRFGASVIRATMEGKLLYTEAYRLTGIRGKTFSEFATRLGFGGDV
ncbi:MAG TPA: ImmA/IrrE family metallo-endopeptidase [Desulfosporosinus sp.]|nr:ImmA/IrrE family metallo-endopeptidase [Desulfosporosinus sp.]